MPTIKSRTDKQARKRAKRREKGIYLPTNPLYPADAYISGDCAVCGVRFPKVRGGQLRCKECADIVRRIGSSLKSFRKVAGGKRRVMRASTDTLLHVARMYRNAAECAYCGRGFTTDNPKTLDHIVPVCTGGENLAHNIAVCCRECNEAKGRLPLERWHNLCRLVLSRLTA